MRDVVGHNMSSLLEVASYRANDVCVRLGAAGTCSTRAVRACKAIRAAQAHSLTAVGLLARCTYIAVATSAGVSCWACLTRSTVCTRLRTRVTPCALAAGTGESSSTAHTSCPVCGWRVSIFTRDAQSTRTGRHRITLNTCGLCWVGASTAGTPGADAACPRKARSTCLARLLVRRRL